MVHHPDGALDPARRHPLKQIPGRVPVAEPLEGVDRHLVSGLGAEHAADELADRIAPRLVPPGPGAGTQPGADLREQWVSVEREGELHGEAPG